MRKIHPYNGLYCHIYNRGVDKRQIFCDETDYHRFLIGLPKFNSKQQKQKNVKILCYCLMPNHFHLLLQQNTDNGLANFMHKLGTSYTKYFNLKYQRTGRLFEGPYKIRGIKDERQLIYLTKYIHSNPIKLFSKNTNKKNQIHKFIENYPWSSCSDYLSPSNPQQIIDTDWVKENMMDIRSYRDFLR